MASRQPVADLATSTIVPTGSAAASDGTEALNAGAYASVMKEQFVYPSPDQYVLRKGELQLITSDHGWRHAAHYHGWRGLDSGVNAIVGERT